MFLKKTLDNTHTNYALNLYVSHASMCLDIYLQRSCYVVPTHYRGGHSYLKGEYSAVYLIVIFSNILNIYVFNWSTHIKVEHLRVKVSFYLLPVQYPVVIAFYVILQAELKKNHCSNGHGTIYLSYFYWWIIKLNSLFYRVHSSIRKTNPDRVYCIQQSFHPAYQIKRSRFVPMWLVNFQFLL